MLSHRISEIFAPRMARARRIVNSHVEWSRHIA